MVITHARSKRKVTGGRYLSARKKRLGETGNEPTLTRVDEKKKMKVVRTRGGNDKQRLLRGNIANLYNPKSKKYEKVVIKTVAESPANRNYIRRNIMTKGSVIETEKGKARVTSRPGQDGIINAVLI